MYAKQAVMSKATRATKMQEQVGIAFTASRYEYDPHSDRIGVQRAERADRGEGVRHLADRLLDFGVDPGYRSGLFRPWRYAWA